MSHSGRSFQCLPNKLLLSTMFAPQALPLGLPFPPKKTTCRQNIPRFRRPLCLLWLSPITWLIPPTHQVGSEQRGRPKTQPKMLIIHRVTVPGEHPELEWGQKATADRCLWEGQGKEDGKLNRVRLLHVGCCQHTWGKGCCWESTDYRDVAQHSWFTLPQFPLRDHKQNISFYFII